MPRTQDPMFCLLQVSRDWRDSPQASGSLCPVACWDPSLALWARSNSWIVASGFQRWIEEKSLPAALWVYTRLVLLQEGEEIPLPAHVTLEVEVRYGKALEATVVCHLDSLGCTRDLLALMRQLGCTRWSPLRARLASLRLDSRERRAPYFGLGSEPESSELLAQRLSAVFGPFTLEWLYAADRLSCEE